jgi:hypothetical protein
MLEWQVIVVGITLVNVTVRNLVSSMQSLTGEDKTWIIED